MKNIYLSLLLSILTFKLLSQTTFYDQTITFESNTDLIQIDNSQNGNNWQIGTPSKAIFNQASSTPYAIVTDTFNYYPSNNQSSFTITVIPSQQNIWGNGVLSFKHKYDFEPNKDGGYIEVKYDADTNWTNIILDSDPVEDGFGFISSNNFYSTTDTILGNIPAFTGSSNDWIESQFSWTWMIGVKGYMHDSITIRFTMQSDSNQTNQEGWMIDDIRIKLDWPSSISKYYKNENTSTVFPNPVNDISTLEFFGAIDNSIELIMYNSLGLKVKENKFNYSKITIKKSDFEPGLYFYQILSNKNRISFGKFIIVK